MDRVKGKTALVTGGSMGMGESHAKLLAREGAKVAVADVSEEKGNAVAEAIRKAGGEAVFIRLDVSREDEWTKAIQAVDKAFKRLDILVNNAGILLMKDVEHTTFDEWKRLLSVNLDGVFLGIHTAIPLMRKGGGGSIINISSISGIVGDANLAAYNASKAGVRLLTKSAALYCAREKMNIRVNSVHPGGVVTPMTQPLLSNPDVQKQLDASTPMGRMAQPIEISWGVLFLASDESSYMTGSELVMDGGMTAI
ncbi:MAG: glucose 1-dehydrogenase [Deltaproteobacteria bacterium]|nr:glucose 1-dehydrogenase [Deltaproteobacteria bacterium]